MLRCSHSSSPSESCFSSGRNGVRLTSSVDAGSADPGRAAVWRGSFFDFACGFLLIALFQRGQLDDGARGGAHRELGMRFGDRREPGTAYRPGAHRGAAAFAGRRPGRPCDCAGAGGAVVALAPAGMPFVSEAHLDPPIAAFTLRTCVHVWSYLCGSQLPCQKPDWPR